MTARTAAAGDGLAASNPKVQRLRRLLGRRSTRAEERAFVLEGATSLGEAVAAGAEVESVYLAPGAGDDERALAERAGAPVHLLAAGVLERVAGTVTPQPVLAVARALDVGLVDAVAPPDPSPGPVVVAAEVRDPGNLGTIARAAAAAGARALVCCAGSVDPYNPKCVRASAGALFHVPLVLGGDTVPVLEQLASLGLQRLGTLARGGTPLWASDLTGPFALVLGNEAHGLAGEAAAALDGGVTIPMAGGVESLNVAVAASVVLFEAARQRVAA